MEKKKIPYFSCHAEVWGRQAYPWLNSFFSAQATANFSPKSTLGHRKSTLDSGLEPLIWGKNGLQTPFLPACRPYFSPIITRKSSNANQMQIETGQK
jgi:hypothetical protein